MQLDRVSLDEHRLESLDAHAMQRRGAVKKHWVIPDHLFQDIPNLIILALQHLLRALNRIGMAKLFEPANDEGLIQLQRNLLRQPALMQLEAGANNDHTARRVVDALTEQVFPEAALLALDHVGERLEWPVGRTEHWTLAAIIVEQRVDRLLQHPLLIAYDHFRRIEIDELFEPIVAVDNSAIQIVEVARCKITAIKEHKWPQIRRDDRNHVEHHPLWLVVRIAD